TSSFLASPCPPCGARLVLQARGYESFPAPIGLTISTGKSKLRLLRAIGQHGPDLQAAGAVGLKNNVPTVRRPGGKIVASAIMRELRPLPAGDIHEVNVAGSGLARTILANPGQCQELPVRRP